MLPFVALNLNIALAAAMTPHTTLLETYCNDVSRSRHAALCDVLERLPPSDLVLDAGPSPASMPQATSPNEADDTSAAPDAGSENWDARLLLVTPTRDFIIERAGSCAPSTLGRWFGAASPHPCTWTPLRAQLIGTAVIMQLPDDMPVDEIPLLFVEETDGFVQVPYLLHGHSLLVARHFDEAVLLRGRGRDQERVVIRLAH